MLETQAEPLGQSPPGPQRQTGVRPLVSHHSRAGQHVSPQVAPDAQLPVGMQDALPVSAAQEGAA
jgi:hypothetical protein